MTSRPNSTFRSPPLLRAQSSPVPSQSFPALRPLATPPTRDSRSRSTNNVHSSGNGTPAKSDTVTYENFNDIMTQKQEAINALLTVEFMIHYIPINLLD